MRAFILAAAVSAFMAGTSAGAQTSDKSGFYARESLRVTSTTPTQPATPPTPTCQGFQSGTWVTAASGYYLGQSVQNQADATTLCNKEYAKAGKYGLCGYYPAEKAVVWFPTTSVATNYPGYLTSLCPQK